MPSAPLHIFISYSRTNTAFVNRLEADLKVRGFHTWVDRFKLEGGQNWMDEIEKAINWCHVLVLAVSPEAVASKWVRMEYRYADQQGKLIIPAYCLPTARVPMDISGLQRVEFYPDHDQGLQSLLIALSRVPVPAVTTLNPSVSMADAAQSTQTLPQLVPPQPAPPPPLPDLQALYDAGMAAWAKGDVEQAAIFWQQLLDRDPHYQGGTLEPQMKRLRTDLHNARLKRYRQLASEANNSGQWGQEIGAWQGLLSLDPRNREAKAGLLQALRAYAETAYAGGIWTDEISGWQTLLTQLPKDFHVEERIALAEHHQQHAWKYAYAEELVNRQDLDTAKAQLTQLYMDAPYYSDPKGLTSRLVGLPPPKNIWNDLREKERRSKFWTPPFTLWLSAFSLLSGVGAIIALSTRSLAWTIGTEIILLPLAYWLGYRKFLNGRIYLSITLISSAIVLGLLWLASTINYQQSIPDPNYEAYDWLIELSSSKLILSEDMFNWLGAGLCFSLIFGTLIAMPKRKRKLSETIKFLRPRRKVRETLKNIFYGALIGVLFTLELLIFIGGVGIASTINKEGASFNIFGALGLFVGLVAGWGVGASPVVWIKAKGLFSRKTLLGATSFYKLTIS